MLEQLRRYLGGMTWAIIVAMLALMAVSLLAIRTAEAAEPEPTGHFARQAAFAGVALAAFVATLIPYHRIGRGAWVWYGLNLALLVLVFFLRPVRGRSSNGGMNRPRFH